MISTPTKKKPEPMVYQELQNKFLILSKENN
jgi:hypothetical protein